MRTPFLAVLLATTLCGQSLTGTYRGNDIQGLRAAAERSPENLGLRLRLTQALLRRDREAAHPDTARARVAEARSQFETILTKDPMSPLPLRVKTLDASRRRNVEQVIALGGKFLDVIPWESDVTRAVIRAQFRSGQKEEAAKTFVEWLGSGVVPPFGVIQGQLATLALSTEFRDTFLKTLDAAIAKQPQNPNLHLYRSIFFLEVGRTESAWSSLHEAEESGLGDLRSGSRHPFAALLEAKAPEFEPGPGALDGTDPEAFGDLRKQHPSHLGLSMRHARLLELLGRQEDALRIYSESLKANGALLVAAMRAGELCAAMKNFEEAANFFDKAIGIVPLNGLARLSAARAWAHQGKADEVFKRLKPLLRRHEPGKSTEEIFEALGNSIVELVALLQKEAAIAPPNAFAFAHLALAKHVAKDAAGAQSAALRSESAGYIGKDGYPAPLLFRVFGETPPEPAQ